MARSRTIASSPLKRRLDLNRGMPGAATFALRQKAQRGRRAPVHQLQPALTLVSSPRAKPQRTATAPMMARPSSRSRIAVLPMSARRPRRRSSSGADSYYEVRTLRGCLRGSPGISPRHGAGVGGARGQRARPGRRVANPRPFRNVRGSRSGPQQEDRCDGLSRYRRLRSACTRTATQHRERHRGAALGCPS